jgi:hypothetical protein
MKPQTEYGDDVAPAQTFPDCTVSKHNKFSLWHVPITENTASKMLKKDVLGKYVTITQNTASKMLKKDVLGKYVTITENTTSKC